MAESERNRRLRLMVHIAQLEVPLQRTGDIDIQSVRRTSLEVLLMDLLVLNSQHEQIIQRLYPEQIREQSRDGQGIQTVRGE